VLTVTESANSGEKRFCALHCPARLSIDVSQCLERETRLSMHNSGYLKFMKLCTLRKTNDSERLESNFAVGLDCHSEDHFNEEDQG